VTASTFRLSALSAALLSATPAWAIGFGDIILHSRIGEPLRAEVPINADADEHLETTCFSLAPLNGSDLPVISGAKTKLVREGSRYRLHITGSKPISEPIFLIGLRAGCGVDLQRDYVLMPAEPLILASPPSTGPSANPPTNGARSRGATAQEWRAREGDTLEGIAETLVPDNLAQQRRMLAALKRANPQLSGRPALVDGTAVLIPDVKQRLAAERETPAPLESKPVSEPPPPPPKPAKSAPTAKAGGVDRILVGDPPAETKPGEKVAAPKNSKAELDERMLKMEMTIQLLNTQIEALDKALALTAETLTLQKKLQVAQAADSALPAPVAKPAEPPPPAPDNSNWLEVLLSALAGGAIAGGIAHLLSRRHSRQLEDKFPTAILRERHPAKSVPEATPESPPIPPAIVGDTAPKAAPAVVTVNAQPAEFSRAPNDLKAVEVRFDQDESAIALAEIMLSFGRPQGATETLARHIEESASDNPRPWLMLLDLYRRGGFSGEYTRLLPALRRKFNLQVPAWQDLETPVSGLKSLEDYEHIASRVVANWGTQACMDYLYQLIHDNRDGQRSGFPLEVVEEIVLLLLVLETAYGLRRER
jgi:pilus assembly protein FimV